MNKERIDGVTIYWAVLGALLSAWAIEWLVGILLAQAALHGMTLQFDQAFTKATSTRNHEPPYRAENPQDAAPAKATITGSIMTVPGRSLEECNALTNGVLNEQWRRCRTTHTETIR